MPKVSVIMAVYNGEVFVKEAIVSILNQTFSDFEFVIINDGSVDGTERILSSYKDQRIIILSNPQNEGLIYSLNKGINYAQGEYIVRMDSDDWSCPTRLQRQVEYMDQHKNVVACGSAVAFFYKNRRFRYFSPVTTNPEEIKVQLLFQNALAHPTMIMRRNILKEYNLIYDKNQKYIEDFGFWNRLIEIGEIHNLKEELLHYRLVPNSQSAMGKRNLSMRKKAYLSIFEPKLQQLKINSDIQHAIHYEIAEISNLPSLEYTLQDYENHLLDLIEKNKQEGLYQFNLFEKECANRFYHCCLVRKSLGYFDNSFFSQVLDKGMKEKVIDSFFFFIKQQLKARVR